MNKISGYENYSVTRDGKVYSHYVNRFLKGTMKGGYYCITLRKNKKQKFFGIHQLVAMVYLPNPDNLGYVNHIDGNKLNNNVENLEWCTKRHDVKHAVENGLTKRTSTPVYQIKIVTKERNLGTFFSMNQAAKKTGISASQIRRSCMGRKTTGPKYRWRFIDKGGEGRTCKRRILQIELITEEEIIKKYESCSGAALLTGVNYNSIIQACQRGCYAGGYKWRYVNERRKIDAAVVKAWKVIPGFSKYKISQKGDIYTIKQNRLLKPHLSKEYVYISLVSDTGKNLNRGVHRLVALAYIENPHNYPIVNHIDGNKQNNNVKNLEWVDDSESIKHAHRAGLINISKKVQKEDQDGKVIEEYLSIKDAAMKNGINYSTLKWRFSKGGRQQIGEFVYVCK